jgi:hypothetical protein
MLHTLAAAAKDKEGKSIRGCLLLVRFEGDSAPKTEKFGIGGNNAEWMAKRAIAWAANPNLNLYAPWAILRADLEANKKGAEADVVAVLALVGDLDADTGKAGGPLPLDAPYILETSAGNFQPIFPLATALAPQDAKPLAVALADVLRCDARTKDISGIWRIPGTLNWPTKNKLERGRPAEPRLVKVSTPWTGDLIAPETLRNALPKKAKSAASEQQHEPKNVTELFKSLSAVERKALAASAYQGEDQNETAASFASRMRADGLSDTEIKALIEAFPQGLGERYVSRGKDLEGDLRRMREKWEQDVAATLFDPWDRYSVPAFPLEVLPATLTDFVKSESAVIGCDPSALAMTALVAVSAALDHRFALKMMRNGNWWASPRLWVLLVGDPSRKKTPAINAATRAAGGDPKDGPAPPPRFVVFDSTVEKLGEILARYDRGLLVKRDEFAGFLGAMERYGSGKGASADRAFWLTAFDGGPYTVDRINRGETLIRNLSVSLVGGIQPERLAELRGLTSDGLLQRFLPLMMSAPTFASDACTNSAAYHLLVRKLLWREPRRFTLSDAALGAMEELRRHLHDLETSAGGLAEGFQAFLGKLAGYAGSLALILHMVAESASEPKVSAETVRRVSVLIRDFLLPHAFEFYRANERASAGDRLQRLASWILTSGKSRLVPSDFTANVMDLRGLGLWDLNQRLSPLVAGGWLTSNDAGPVARSWRVAPGVVERFKQQAATEEQRKARIAELMNSPRRKANEAG